MDLLGIARRLESQHADMVRRLAAESVSVAGGWVASNGAGSYLNKAVGFGIAEDVPAKALALVEEFHATRGIEPRLELTAFAPIPLLRAAADRGFVLQELENVLVVPLEGADLPGPALPPGVRLVPVDRQDEAQLRTFVHTGASGFLAPGEELPDEWMETGLRVARAPEHDGLLAYVEDRVAGAAGASTEGGVTSLFGASVRPEFRRRGIQQALIAARIARGRALGADLATITSRPGIPTERNAGRLGFHLAYVRLVLVKRGPGLVPSR